MNRAILVEAFDQIAAGRDIPTPKGMLRIKPERAAEKHKGLPYSLLTNLAHANLWQTLWINKLQGIPNRPITEIWKDDFRVPDPSEFVEIRKEFLDGLDVARSIAASEPFVHKCDSDQVAIETLVQILIHGAYHCGQMNLLKRIK